MYYSMYSDIQHISF